MGKCEQCIVRELSALRTLSREELLRISNCKTAVPVKKGERIFTEGQTLNGVYCVREGVSKLTKLSANGREQIVKFATKGDLIGQRSLVSGEPANLSATALEDMQVCFVPKNDILGVCGQNAGFSMELLKSLAGNLRESDELMVEFAQKTVIQRLAHALLHLEERFGTKSNGFLRLRLSREELSSLAGTAVESGIRLLSDLAKKGMITIEGKDIAIIDRAALRKLSH